MEAIQRCAKWGVWLSLGAILTIGCSPLQTLGFIFHSDAKIPAEFPLRPKEGPKKEKDEELKVLVLSHQRPGIAFEFAGADLELASSLAKQLPALAKDCKENITVLPPAQLARFKAANPEWSRMHASAIGKKLGADFVIEVHLSTVSVYQPGSGSQIYEGRAEVYVDVYDVAVGAGEPAHKYVHQYIYPKTGMLAASDIPLARFKQLFLERLALELSRKHVEYKAGDGIAAER